MKKSLTKQAKDELLQKLFARFEANPSRHPDIQWPKVLEKLEKQPSKLWSLSEMENTGGEPDIVSFDSKKNEFLFIDCAPESPIGRRSICYDQQALDSRKENKPKNSAQGMADQLGIDILSEEQYRWLQSLGPFDQKTSSWVKTPAEIRQLGGALFCDRRFNTVFVYHNGAESYYAARGFRGCLIV